MNQGQLWANRTAAKAREKDKRKKGESLSKLSSRQSQDINDQ